MDEITLTQEEALLKSRMNLGVGSQAPHPNSSLKSAPLKLFQHLILKPCVKLRLLAIAPNPEDSHSDYARVFYLGDAQND